MIKKNSLFLKILLSLLLIGFFVFTRFQNLNSIPVFGDEAIYVRWSQIIKSVDTLRFVPQTDGKQPLFMWFTAGYLKFVEDPLMAGRIVSISAGIKTLISVFLTTAVILSFKKKSKNPFTFIISAVKDNFYPAYLTALLYCLLPFTFFFDRMALPDNSLSTLGAISLLFALLLAKFRRLDLSLILGVFLGLAWLTKSPAIYFVVLSFLTYLVLNLKNLKTLYLPLISSFIAFAIYNILRLGPQFHMIALRNKDYVWSISEILKHPFDPLKPHLLDTLTIYGQYISWPLLVLPLLVLLIFIINKKFKFNILYLVLIAWWLLPLLSNSALAKVFTARYILFTLPPLIILISLSLSRFIKKSYLQIIIILLFSIPNLIFIRNLSLKPFEVNLSSTESGYLQDWTSGWGIEEVSSYLKDRSTQANVIVGTEGSFGTLPDGLQIYTNQVNQLTVFGLGLDFTEIPEKLIDAKNHGDEVYIVINKSRFRINSLDQDKLKLIKSYPKPDQDELLLYQL